MSLDGLLLEKLARWRPDGRQALEVSAPESGWAATITADAVDVVGCRLWDLSLKRAGDLPAGERVAALRDRAEAIAKSVTGLLEPLGLIEVDQAGGVALLRSNTPTRRGDVISYYEALVHADGDASFRRYEGPQGEAGRRQQVTYALTHETLAKLATDLTV
jgi:hypothetical protein